jgi:3-dehydroquinate synthetase
VKRLAAVLRAGGLPLEPPALETERFLELMGHDKKVEGGRIRFVLLKRIGEAFISGEVPRAALVEVLGAGQAHARA